MHNLSKYILEKLKINKDSQEKSKLDIEMEEWENRMKEPFGLKLKDLQKAIMDLGTYPVETNEYGLKVYTPIDGCITEYALDGNKKYTYKKIKDICINYDYGSHAKISNLLNILKKFI